MVNISDLLILSVVVVVVLIMIVILDLQLSKKYQLYSKSALFDGKSNSLEISFSFIPSTCDDIHLQNFTL